MTGDGKSEDDATRRQTDVPGNPSDPGADSPALFVIKGGASPEEVAALVAVLQASAATEGPPADGPRSEWSAHHRKVRASFPSGPGGWRSSAMPR